MDAAEIIPAYAAAGLPVLPLHAMRNGRCTCGRADCHSPAKHPLTRHGKDDATTDLGTIAEWLARWPWANWGVRPPVGVVIADVDVRSGGFDTLADLERRNEPFPPTLTAETGSGGRHYWFSYNGPARGRMGRGIDVKTNSGYVVAPPSVHACGGEYRWLDQRPAAYAPAWVRAILNPPIRRFSPTKGGGGDRLVGFVADAPPHEGNNRLFWAACRAAEKGIDPTPLIEAAVSRGRKHSEAVATVRSAYNTAGKRAA